MFSNRKLFRYENHFEKIVGVNSRLIIDSDNKKEVFFTIIIPTFKRHDLLKDAIDSALNQNGFEDYEILVVDNEPENDRKSHQLLLTYKTNRIRYFKHEQNIGMFGNWNRAIELARGKWITLLHDDDYFLPGILHRVKNEIDANSNIEGIKAAQVSYVQPPDGNIKEYANSIKKAKEGTWKLRKTDNFFRNSLQTPCGIFFLKQNVVTLGGFNPDYYPAADYLFTTNYLYHYNMFHTTDVWWICRVLNNESQNANTRQKIMEQNYYIRKSYGDLLGIPMRLMKPLLLFLSIEDVRYVKSLNFNIDNKFLIRVIKIKLPAMKVWTFAQKLFYGEQRLRKILSRL